MKGATVCSARPSEAINSPRYLLPVERFRGRTAGRTAGGRAAGGAVSDLNHHGCRNDYSAGWHVRPCAYLIICPDQRPAAGRPALARVGTFSTQFRFKI